MPLRVNGTGQPCPFCGRIDIAAVVLAVPDVLPASPFTVDSPDAESPASGCCSCGRTYGNWLDEYAG